MANEWEMACKEFLKGCSCIENGKQESCPECLKAFCDKIRSLEKKEKDIFVEVVVDTVRTPLVQNEIQKVLRSMANG